MEWGLSQLDRGLWVVNVENRAPGGLYMPLRTTLVETPMGLWVRSPAPFSEKIATELETFAPIGALVAPNRLHHLHLNAAANRWKEAQIFLAPGLAEKVPTLPAGQTLTDQALTWGPDLETYAIAGAPGLSESTFFHRPSGSLIVTELLFHLVGVPDAWSRTMLHLTGVSGKLAKSRVWWMFIKDQAAWKRSVERILELPIRRLIPAHGEVLEAEPDQLRGRLREVLL